MHPDAELEDFLRLVDAVVDRARASEAEAAAGEQRLIPIWELLTYRIRVPASRTYRGITRALRRKVVAAARRWGATGPIDVAHITPHVLSRAGDWVLVRPQAASVNRAEGRDIARAAAARRRLGDPRLPVR